MHEALDSIPSTKNRKEKEEWRLLFPQYSIYTLTDTMWERSSCMVGLDVRTLNVIKITIFAIFVLLILFYFGEDHTIHVFLR